MSTVLPLFSAEPERTPAVSPEPALQAAFAGGGAGLLIGVAVGLAVAGWRRRRRHARSGRSR